MAKKIGILTGGGDCPGLNSVIRAAVWKGIEEYGFEMVGIRRGWKGLTENLTTPLTLDNVTSIWNQGGTILNTSRTNPYKEENGVEKAKDTYKKLKLEGLIAIGGDDTLMVAYNFFKEGFNTVGVPKTIDNDVAATDYTFGFDTAINIAMETLDRLHTTAASHERVMVVELMGRHAGWITLEAGIAGGADIIIIPETPFEIDNIVKRLKKIREGGKNYAIVAVSEGAKISTVEDEDEDGSFVLKDLKKDAFGHVKLGGIGKVLADEIEDRTGYETRSVQLGHIQRGGPPTAFDRFLGTRFGLAAIDLVAEGKFGNMTALKGNQIVTVSLEKAAEKTRTVPDNLKALTGFFSPKI
ncbi:ATP-dependent 6-phosphofructokinase [bacterium]|nr:ATP-dependent 6-phosphofructokinase [bacterium]